MQKKKLNELIEERERLEANLGDEATPTDDIAVINRIEELDKKITESCEAGRARKEVSMKPRAILAIMEGIIDGTWGIGSVDLVMKETLEGKSIDEIMLDLVEKKRMKEKKESGQGGEGENHG